MHNYFYEKRRNGAKQNYSIHTIDMSKYALTATL